MHAECKVLLGFADSLNAESKTIQKPPKLLGSSLLQPGGMKEERYLCRYSLHRPEAKMGGKLGGGGCFGLFVLNWMSSISLIT